MKLWTRWHRPQLHALPADLRNWLIYPGSLTRQLQQHCEQTVSVKVLASRWQRPLPDEALLLNQSAAQFALQREVQLLDGDKARVYARTVIPVKTYQAMCQRFDALGNQPLGEMLFTDPSVSRGPIEVASLRPGQKLYEMAVHDLSSRPQQLWGRRSCFYLAGKVMLINEIFLPAENWSNQ
jgi:chorismate--pyruvate lyase